MSVKLEAKACQYQRLIEEVFLDKQGLIRGCVERATRQPWSLDYFDSTRDFLRAPGLPPPHAMWAYEQTNMCHGFYLLSLVYQHKVTGAPQSLALARRTFEAIWAVYQMAPPAERGFLTKPYGGKLSRETHADQYFPVVLGLAAYHDLATAEERLRTLEMITHFADWWIRQQYKLVYFGIPIQISGRTRLNLMPLFGLAYQLSGETKYRDELLSQLEEITPALPLFSGNAPPERVRSPFGRYCGWFLSTDYLLKNEYMTEELGRALLGDYWRAAEATLADDGMCYVDVAYNPETDQFYLPKTGYSQTPLFEDRIKWDFVYWVGHLKSAYGTAGFGAASVVVQRWLPEQLATSDAFVALANVEEERLSSYVDDEGGQLDGKHEWLTDDFRADAVTLWLLAYWMGRHHGFWE